MKYFGPAEGYVLIPLAGQSCVKSGCLREATHILIGKENDFIEFYCFEHGTDAQTRLENKYQFDRINQKPQIYRKKRKRERSTPLSVLQRQAREAQEKVDKAQEIVDKLNAKVRRLRKP